MHLPEIIFGFWLLILTAGDGTVALGIHKSEADCMMHKHYTQTLWHDGRIQAGLSHENLTCEQILDEPL